jgi:hypothetical protein
MTIDLTTIATHPNIAKSTQQMWNLPVTFSLLNQLNTLSISFIPLFGQTTGLPNHSTRHTYLCDCAGACPTLGLHPH